MSLVCRHCHYNLTINNYENINEHKDISGLTREEFFGYFRGKRMRTPSRLKAIGTMTSRFP